jgi:hypothetical protein
MQSADGHLRQLYRDTEAARRVGLENSPASSADSE